MKTKELNIGYNVVPIIDELIMELSYIKNGYSYSIVNLKNGVKMIEHLISLSEKLNEKSSDDKLGFIPVHEKKHSSSIKFENEIQTKELIGVKEKIDILIKEENIDLNSIEPIQELLLKISLPFWKEQVSILKPKQFKLIEL